MTEIAVFVDSRGGNTRKLADAIAEELGVPVGDLTAPLPDDVKMVFLGSGTYGGKAGEMLMKFVESAPLSGRKVALFGTSASQEGAQKMMDAVATSLVPKGATLLGRFHCRGKFLLANRGHPDNEDLENGKRFARAMIGASKQANQGT
jgi:flavodoxin